MKTQNTNHPFGKVASLMIFAPVLLVLGGTSAMASQLIYTPVNPSFGGNAFNGPYLMSIAEKQASKNSPDPLAGLDLSSFSSSMEDMNAKLDQLLDDQNAGTGTGTSTTSAPTSTSPM